eukprot:COSAG02_NODE_34260_length_486_cov_20.697674_1_plen_24_part_10
MLAAPLLLLGVGGVASSGSFGFPI